MNTRQPIQPNTTPAVLSLSFSASRNRFICGLADGVRILRSDNCLATYQPSTTDPDSPFTGGIALAEALDDRCIAFVAGGRTSVGKESVVIFWDCLLEREVQRLEFAEPVKGLRLSGKWMVVVLQERSILFAYQQLQEPTPPPENDTRDSGDDDTRTKTAAQTTEESLRGPNKVHALHPTSSNPFALISLRNDLLVLPAQSIGQIQLIPLPSGSKRVLRAHNTALRCIGLSPSGNLLASASEQGTLIRVFNTTTLDQIAEFRRGVEKAIIYSLAFSDGERWLACTSDKGTVHVFDLRPPVSEPPAGVPASQSNKSTSQSHRKSSSNPTAPNPHRLSGGRPSSTLSGRSSPTTATVQTQQTGYHGSIQEYYGLRPPPTMPSPNPGVSAVAAFKQSSWAPKLLKDVRSVASAPFIMGEEGPYWQGGSSHSWTTAPGGVRKRVRNPVRALPADPTGKPVKGVVAFAPAGGEDGREDDVGAVLYVVGGGTDARWECFDLVPREGGGWVLVRRGWRGYLGRQFVD
ncbi:Phosphatidylinositol 3,5-bisphosphate-binding protein [Saxophila tyrrhenica]|uniref:Phosphatidylinositol 3,5-bisphosphate-binding protein n=1 Tax=Saxophila tyrrhenica TaxID=1690608 RepID=A0AAV9PDU9_9PEZI|nr:Phosphatidylinositol 3,5-bisphosphate-binding protein [Saxophila tyrrhenica]